MDRKRERYNAKARHSVVGGASHKKRRRRSVNGPTRDAAGAPVEVIADPNAEIITLKPLEQKELDRRERLKQQVRTRSVLVNLPTIQASFPRHPPVGDRRRYKLFKKEEKETGKIYCV